MINRRLTFLFTIAVVLAGCSSWFYGDSNAPSPSERPQVSDPLLRTEKRWQYALGEGGAAGGLALTPVQGGDAIFAISADGRLYRFSAQSGEREWRVRLGTRISAGLTLGDRAIYAGSEKGDVLAISPRDGHILWRTPLGALLLARPVFGDGLVVVKTIDGTVSALDPVTGTIRWRYVSYEPMLGMHGSSSALVGGGVVILMDDNGYFSVLDEKNGLPVARTRMAMGKSGNKVANLVDQLATPKVNQSTLFASAYQHLVYAVDLENGGMPIWQNQSVSTLKDFAMDPKSLYIATPDDTIVALSQADGSERWRYQGLRGRHVAPPVAIPGRVGVLDEKGYLYWLDSASGELIGESRLGGTGSRSEALVLDDLLIWQLSSGHLVAFRPT